MKTIAILAIIAMVMLESSWAGGKRGPNNARSGRRSPAGSRKQTGSSSSATSSDGIPLSS